MMTSVAGLDHNINNNNHNNTQLLTHHMSARVDESQARGHVILSMSSSCGKRMS